MNQQFSFDYACFASASELDPADKALLEKARAITAAAYAPYSNFKVGAAAVLDDGRIVTATNQENASYPVGICAERTLLSAESAMHANKRILTLAISYASEGKNDRPISPCGLCRQSLAEYEQRSQQPIRLLLGGQTGAVYIIPDCVSLLPLGFSGEDLNR